MYGEGERPLRVCIDARMGGNTAHGAALYTLGVLRGLLSLNDGEEEYYALAYRADTHALRKFGCDAARVIMPRADPTASGERYLRHVPGATRLWRRLRPVKIAPEPAVPLSDGAIEAAGIDVIHFPRQYGFATALTSIYQPHDIQHVHCPENFSAEERRRRDVVYGGLCAAATRVVMMTDAGRCDLTQNFGVEADKVAVVPGAPLLALYPAPDARDLARTQAKFGLPQKFALFPAQTWAHKNHIGLVRALARLRDEGLQVPLVCSGVRNGFYREIEAEIQRLGMRSLVCFVDFVTPLELHCLYRLARGVVFPTKFEGWGFPVVEGFYAGTPLACSDIGPLREQAQGAALLFDPDDPGDIAAAVRRIWMDGQLRTELKAAGSKRVAQFTWERVARTFRAHYRAIGRRPLSSEDRALLAPSLPAARVAS